MDLELLFEHYDIIVIESFGVGGMPETLMEAFYKEMDKWAGQDKLAVMTTQVANELRKYMAEKVYQVPLYVPDLVIAYNRIYRKYKRRGK